MSLIFSFLYTASLYVYGIIVHFVALFNPKAKRFVQGRKSWKKQLKKTFENNKMPLVWFHAASLGEFEQGRPVIELFRTEYPNYKILLTFFSPSGYEVRKNYNQADYVCYLPLDTVANARTFVKITQPKMVFFIKYEFWLNYINVLNKHHIPTISFSSIFSNKQYFFKPYGKYALQTLKKIDHFFVQNNTSLELLKANHISQATVAGDTRFDRVKEICDANRSIPLANAFKQNSLLLVLGSVWMSDIEIIAPVLVQKNIPIKIIIAPHEIGVKNIEEIEKTLLPLKSCRFSQTNETNCRDFDVLLIDNIGMLSTLYRYADLAYIGGGFGAGVHNTLEAATFGMPIIVGNCNHQKFQEVMDLIKLNAIFCIENQEEFKQMLYRLCKNEEKRLLAAQQCKSYVDEQLGATSQIMAYVKTKLSN